MKIVMLQDDFPPHAKGGAGIIAAAYARELARLGNEVIVITAVQEKWLEGSFVEEGIRIERIYSSYAPRWRSWRSLYNPSVVRRVRALLKEVSPQVVHAHNVHYHLSYWSLRAAKTSGAAVFLTAHDAMLFHYGKLSECIEPRTFSCRAPRDYRVHWQEQLRIYGAWYNPFRNLCIRYALQSVDKIFAVSEALREALEQNGITDVSTLHNGIDEAAFDIAEEEIMHTREKWRLKDTFVILFGGRLSGLKGAEAVIDAVRSLSSKHARPMLLVLGTRDEYARKLETRAFDIADRVVFTDWVSGTELKAALHIADVVVAPSQYLDPLPTIVLEGMACGKPIVGGCIGGITEMVSDGRTGFVVNPFSPSAIAAKIEMLINDPARRESFGSEGKREVRLRFNLRAQTARLEDMYRRALDVERV